MAPPTAPAEYKSLDGGAAEADLPVADVVVADETTEYAETTEYVETADVETVEPLAAATASFIESDAVLAQRLQNEEHGALLVRPGPPAGRVAVVESQYYGPVSFLASCLLFTVFPPCALIPCFSPCDKAQVVTVQPDGAVAHRRFQRRVFVVVPPGVRCGDTLQTTTPENIVLSVRVPPRTEPGSRICVQY
jgi:hypothetical protein